ncbi:hypothetical protein LCF65_001085 [Campylobacter jejuni]|nr:hypothetical protein [Campylobacter jejuni]
MNNRALFDELMDELNTQSLARFNFNIFNLNTYAAMVESAKLTTNMQKDIKQHGKNPNGFGQFFETLEVGKKNIKSAYFQTGEQTYTTDELAAINHFQQNKNFNTLNDEKTQTIMANYSDEEIQNIAKNQNLFQEAKTNHPLIDIITIDKNGKVTQSSQLKAIGHSIFSSKYNKYYDGIKNNQLTSIIVDEQTYNNAELEIQNLKDRIKNAPKEKQEILRKQLQEKEWKFKCLEKGSNKEKAGYQKDTNHTNTKSPINESIKTQAMQTGIHIAQTGISEATIVALSTFASGVIYEMHSEFIKKNHENIEIRIKRILNIVIQKSLDAFQRGASFGVLDSIITIISQIFKKIGGHLKSLWSNIRKSLKSIWNAIWDFINGKIKSKKDLIKIILKSLFSAIIITFSITVEEQISALLSPILTPLIASPLAIAVSIFLCSFAVVAFAHTIDVTLDAFFSICASVEMAKKRKEEIEAIYNCIMPKMIENQNKLEKFISNYLDKLKINSHSNFKAICESMQKHNYALANQYILLLAKEFDITNLFKTQKEFDHFMLSNETLKF